MRGPLPSVSRRGKVTIGVVAGALLLLIFLDQIVDLWTDWLWYSEVGYTQVFGGLIRTRIWLFVLFGVGVAAFVAANLYLAFRLRPMMRSNSPEQQALERYRMVLSPRIGLWIGLAASRIGLFECADCIFPIAAYQHPPVIKTGPTYLKRIGNVVKV